MSELHRIEALPGEGRYAITYRRADGTEETAVAQLTGDRLDVAPASLPAGCTDELLAATTEAVRALDAARRLRPAGGTLRDVAGGWDVTLGNVVLDAVGTPTCTAHGAMSEHDGAYVCGDCDARALLS